MPSYNRVIMMGNLTRDPDYKQLASGQSVCKLGLASNRQFRNKQTGMMVQEVCFVDIDVWGPQADSCNQYLQKGAGVLVEGRLKFDTWQDNDGQRRSKHCIVADRVTFLPASQSVSSENIQDDQQKGSNTKEDNVETYTSNVKAATKVSDNNNTDSAVKDNSSKTDSPTGEIAFKDQEPFEDDLPF